MEFSPSLVWFLAGVIFLIAELFVPGIILIFFTAGCWITSLTLSITDIDMTRQFLISIISSLILLFTLRKYGIKIFKGTERENIDDNYSSSKIGKKAIVTKTISIGSTGEIKFIGSFWRAFSDVEIEAGQTVVIESQESEDGLTFKVTPL